MPIQGLLVDFSKRGCSLPFGCKDLIDVLKPKAMPLKSSVPLPWFGPVPSVGPTVVKIQSRIPVKDLASLLGCDLLVIFSDLLSLGIYVTSSQLISFEVAAQVAAKHGFFAEKIE